MGKSGSPARRCAAKVLVEVNGVATESMPWVQPTEFSEQPDKGQRSCAMGSPKIREVESKSGVNLTVSLKGSDPAKGGSARNAPYNH